MEIEKMIEENYDIKVSSYIPYRDGFIINAQDKQKYFLKSVPFSEERLLFIDGLKKYLNRNGFHNTDGYITTKQGSIGVPDDPTRYVLSEFIPGRECDFFDSQDITAAAYLLAEFHNASEGYVQPGNAYMQNYLGLTPKWYAKKIKEFKRIKNRASDRKTMFDSLLMENADYFLDRSETALAKLKQSRYRELVKKAQERHPVCHNDFSYYSILCSDKGMYLINFDSCRYELCIFDLADFLVRRMRKCNWDISEAKRILKIYDSVRPLSDDELQLLKIIITFPEKLCKTVNRYYNSKRTKAKSGYFLKLQEIVDEIPFYEKFMERFSF
jgi:CotS family spore coat protein